MATIRVRATPRDITVTPTRLGFPTAPGNDAIEWRAEGPDVDIVAVRFDNPNAPINNLRKVGANWQGDWSTGGTGVWKYTVTVSVGGKEKLPLDPEIQNGPPDP